MAMRPYSEASVVSYVPGAISSGAPSAMSGGSAAAVRAKAAAAMAARYRRGRGGGMFNAVAPCLADGRGARLQLPGDREGTGFGRGEAIILKMSANAVCAAPPDIHAS